MYDTGKVEEKGFEGAARASSVEAAFDAKVLAALREVRVAMDQAPPSAQQWPAFLYERRQRDNLFDLLGNNVNDLLAAAGITTTVVLVSRSAIVGNKDRLPATLVEALIKIA